MYLEPSRRVDDLGRIVIPRKIRESLEIKAGDLIDIRCINGEIILKKIIDEEGVVVLEKWKHFLRY